MHLQQLNPESGRKARATLFSWIIRLPLSPLMAFALCFPTIGYYTFATYTSLADVEGSAPAIAFRAVALMVLIAAFISGCRKRISLPAEVLPGAVFLIIYFLRMLENTWAQGLEIPPNTNVAFLNYILGVTVTSIALAALWRGYTSHDARIVFSGFAVLFLIGAMLNIGRVGPGEETTRLGFEKINPISLAYVCSTFLLYYLIIARKSKGAALEAILAVPLLLLIAVQAKSRGMFISTAAVVVLYFILLRGGQRIVLAGLAVVLGVIAASWIDPTYLEGALLSLERIDTTEDMSTAMRALSFRGAYEQFLDDPWFGRYVNEKYTNFYPHNIYLESLMAVGILGSLPFVIHLVLSSIAAVSILRMRSVDWVWTLVALIFFRELVGGAASGSIWGNNGFWITSFIVIALWYEQGRRVQSRVTSLHK